MEKYERVYTQTVIKLLTDHAGDAVPDSVDVWHKVEQRLGTGITHDTNPVEQRPFDWLFGTAAPTAQSAEAYGRAYEQGARGYKRHVAIAGGLLGLLLLAALTAIPLSILRHNQGKGVAPGQSTATPIHPTTDSMPLFSIPSGPSGIQDPYRLSGFAVGEYGSFWIGDGEKRILHYSDQGAALNVVGPGSKLYSLQDIEVRGSDLWVLDGFEGFVYVYKLGQDGSTRAEYRVPEGIGEAPNWEPVEKGINGIALAPGGEVLIEKDFMSPYVQVVDAKGKLNPVLLEGYPAVGKLYTAQTDGPPVKRLHTGHITAGDVTVTVAVSGTLAGLKIVKVDADGNFYVTADNWVESETGAPGYGSSRYLLHYSALGQLLRHARVPQPTHLTSDPSGAFFALAPQLNKDGIFDRVEVYRLNFFDAEQPLPSLPTPTVTPVLPTPTPAPPTDTPTPTSTPIINLATLVQQSDLIVRAKVDFSDGQTHTQYYSLLPQEWIKNPDGIIADKLSLWVLAGRDWGRRIPLAIEAVPFDQKSDKEYILFMHLAQERQWDRTPSYYLTDEFADSSGIKFSNAGVFSILDGKIDFAGIPRYQGWTVDNFVKEIHHFAPTPVPVEKRVADLSLMGQKSNAIAEIEWLNRPSREVSALGGKRHLSSVKVTNWLKGGFKMGNLGLMLTQEEHDRLAAGSGHYILFFGTGDSDAQTSCDYSLLRYYWPLQAGLASIFEVRNGNIIYSGVEGYTGYSLDKFKDAMRSAIPTPRPEPTSEGEAYGLSFNDWISEAQIIASVELEEDANITAATSVTTTFKVIKWLKKPSNYTSDTIRVAASDMEACTFSLGKGPYMLFLRLDKNAPADAAPVGPYYTYGMPMFGIRDGLIEYGTEYQYWGQTIEKLEADIRAALP